MQEIVLSFERVSVAVVKHQDQKKLREEKGLFRLCILNHSPRREAKAGTQTRCPNPPFPDIHCGAFDFICSALQRRWRSCSVNKAVPQGLNPKDCRASTRGK
ncbi:hypothetical protein STEG23_027804, partial [Scotinomys teguina]